MRASRLATAVLVLVGSMALLCSLTLIVPGDPATILLGPRATPETVAIFREQMGLEPADPRTGLRVLLQRAAGRSRRRRAQRPPGRRHGDRRAAQHDPAGALGDRAGRADRHSDRLLRGGPARQPARPGAGGGQRRPRRDAELCRGDPAALFLLGPARLVPGARRRRCRQLPRPAASSGAADAWRSPSAGSATSRGWCAPRCWKCWASRTSAPPRLWPAGTPRGR